jgi:hypothetical protein
MNMNKKWILAWMGILPVGFLCAESSFKVPPLSVDTSLGFRTEHVERGAKLGQQVITTEEEISVSPFENGDLYLGSRSVFPIQNQRFKKHTLYLGASGVFGDVCTLDARFTHHLYRNRYRWYGDVSHDPVAKRRSEEISIGVLADVLLNPSLYCFYDFTWRRFCLEGGIHHTCDLAQAGIQGFAIDALAKIGCDRTGRPFSLKDAFDDGRRFHGLKKRYVFYVIGADVIYTFNEHATARVGPRLEGANGKKAWISKISEGKYRRNLLYISTSIDCSF